MKISIIIPTLNAQCCLSFLLDRLNHQTISPEEIIIIDSSSDDDTVILAKSGGAKVISISREEFDHGGTRNMAVSISRGDIIIFLTQDAVPADDRLIENLIRPLASLDIPLSYGRQIPRADAHPVEKFARSFNYPSEEMVKSIDDIDRLGVKTFFFSDVCCAIRKSKFMEVGGFPHKIIMNEDMFLAARILQKGYKIAYKSDAVVHHSHNYSLFFQFRRYFDIGVFFNRNRWIMKLARSEKEGFRYIKEELAFLAARRQYGWILYALAENSMRFAGYKIGLLENMVPVWLKEKLSYNKAFWKT